MLPNINNWVDMMANELAVMFNSLSIEEKDIPMEASDAKHQDDDFCWDKDGDEPIVGKDMNFKDDSISSKYSEKSEGSDEKTYDTDETDHSDENKDEKDNLTISAHFLIPKSVVAKYVTDILRNDKKDLEFDSEALEAIQTALEAHLVKLFEISKMISIHYKREITPEDVTLAQKFI